MSKTVLVTGASKGIGKSIAARLGADGFSIVVHFHSDQGGAEDTVATVEGSGASARLMQFDVCDRDASKQFIEADIEEHGAYYADGRLVCAARRPRAHRDARDLAFARPRGVPLPARARS